jgi:small-conductance mechanosensitive channel
MSLPLPISLPRSLSLVDKENGMFKNIFLAILIAIVLTYSLGHFATQWLDLHVSLAEHDFEPFTSILVLTGIVAILVVVGFIIAFSIFAAIVFAIVFAFIVAGIGLFFAGLSVFWPVFLFIIVIFILVRDKQTPAY